MKPTVCVVSVGTTSKMIANVLAELTLPATFVFKEMLVNDASDLTDDLEKYDVIFSSGNNAQVLKRLSAKPLISISPSLYDILYACSQALAYTATPVIITNRDAFSHDDLEKISSMLAVKIILEFYDRTDHGIEELILKYKAMGHTCVIGSGMVCEFAQKHQLRSIYLFPDESIRNSLTTAAHMAVSIYQKTAQNLHLSSVINSSKTGILMVDNAGVVFLSNPIARQYLQVSERECTGNAIAVLFDRNSVETIMEATGTRRFFMEVGSYSYAVEVIPIISRGEVADRLVYIEDLNVIRNTEHEFRREVWTQKGFTAKYTFQQYHSVNREFQDFLSIAKSFAKTEEPVVILGETGVGKEVLAQSIHNHSNRSGKAFVAVNCAAIPENLLESELFGYSEGAFTGAKKGGKEGYFEMAHMGTIFLDEIGEMNVMLQSKLLRVVQEKQVLRVGATKLIPFDARIIVATNKNLWQLVEDNTFRKDLYYRLNVLELEVPPLRDRPDDTVMLFGDFARDLSYAMWEQASRFVDDLAMLLSSYSWPGNVRELENFVHMLVAHWRPAMPSEELYALIVNLLGKKRQRLEGNAPLPAFPSPSPVLSAGGGLLRDTENRQIRRALDSCGNNINQAAVMLGIHRTTLWRKLKRMGIRR